MRASATMVSAALSPTARARMNREGERSRARDEGTIRRCAREREALDGVADVWQSGRVVGWEDVQSSSRIRRRCGSGLGKLVILRRV